MSEFARIDPTKGPHAAAELSDDQVEYLCKLMLWEVSMRTSKTQCVDFLEDLVGIREDLDHLIGEARQERDLMAFEADVLADLDDLLVTGSPSVAEPTTGMYL